MKKLIAFLLCLIVVVPVFAKNDKDRNEFSVTYGQFTVPQFAYVLGEVFGVMFTLGHASFEEPHMYGAAGIEYVHYTNDWFGFGGTVLCDYMTAKTVSVDKDGNKTPNGDFKLGCLSAMPLVKFAWLNRRTAAMRRTTSRSPSRPRPSAWTSAANSSAASWRPASAGRAS